MGSPRILHGARVALYVNGQAFGRVMGFQWSATYAQKPVYALDSSSAYELIPTQAKVIGTVNVYRLVGDGGAEGAQMATQFQDMIRQKYFTLALVERSTGLVLFQANRCSLQGQSWNAPIKGFVTGVINFEALEWENEVPAAPA